MLNHETIAPHSATGIGSRLLRPGTALRIVLALITVLYVAGPTALQWMSMSAQRAEVAALRSQQAQITMVGGEQGETLTDVVGQASIDADSVIRPAVARVANIDVPANRFVAVVQGTALRTIQVGLAALLSLIITVRRSSNHQPRHARPGLSARLLIRKT